MADTTFVDGTVIEPAWLNDVNDFVYTTGATLAGTNTGDQNLFSTIAVSGQSNVVADSVSDTLTLAAGAGITITTDASTDTVTIAAPTAGAMVLISSTTVSAAATADIETTFNSTYDTYVLVGNGITISTNGLAVNCRLKVAGAYATTGYEYVSEELGGGSGTAFAAAVSTGGAATSIQLLPLQGNSAQGHFDIRMNVYNPASTSLKKHIQWEVVGCDDSARIEGGNGFGKNTSTSALTGVRIYPSSGTITGTFYLYGLKKS